MLRPMTEAEVLSAVRRWAWSLADRGCYKAAAETLRAVDGPIF